MTETFIVDMKFVQKIFRQDFWDRLAKLPKDEDKSEALKIPKTVGLIWETHPPFDWLDMSKEVADIAVKSLTKRFFRDPGCASGST